MNANSTSQSIPPSPAPSQGWSDKIGELIEMPPAEWQERDYHAVVYFKHGLLLGAVAGCVSLLANIVGSVAWPAISGEPQHPLRLIQIYLTFPLGETALQLDSGHVLAFGCILYVLTGMLYGAVLVGSLSFLFPRADLESRIVLSVVFGVMVWGTNFYLILSWLQPLLFNGNWILQLIPWWVAALTHAIFGLTVAVLYPFATARERIDSSAGQGT